MTTSVPLQPTTMLKHVQAVHPAFALMAACKLDLFTPLKDGPLTAEQIAAAIGVSPVKLKPLLYALVAAELLTVSDGLFGNTEESNHFLVKGRPTYRGGAHTLWADIWNAEMKTADSIRTGTAQAKHDFAAMSREELETFLRGMNGNTLSVGRMLASGYDFSSCRTLVDVGGGAGGLAITITDAHPQIRATVVELPSVTPITKKVIAEVGATERVQVVTADVLRDGIKGAYDVALLKAFIQTLSVDDARRALINIGKVVNPRGIIYILGAILDNSRLSPISTVTGNLTFINVYDGGQAYTESEHFDWLREAGFEDCKRTFLPDDSSLIIARKRA